MRLVDADAIKDKLERKIINPQTAFINSILINLLYEAPTAYDVDKVVEQLEEVSYYAIFHNKTTDIVMNANQAIEIVKGGVTNG